jgi:hypothetical protein
MVQIFFLDILYLTGLSFGICFKKWIPFKFIALSGFLWGSILFSFAQILLFVMGIRLTTISFMALLAVIFTVPFLFSVKTNKNGLKKNEWIIIFFVLLNFTLLNLLFIYFSFSVATPDSFLFLRLGRTIALEGFSSNVIEMFSAWGLLIPILQSASAYLKLNYLDTLQFSFAISFVALFYYCSEKICFNLIHKRNLSIFVSIVSTVVLISTPMFIIQTFYIHSNLTAAIFLFTALICGWMAVSENNNYWLVFLSISFVGINFSRSESFIYSDLILYVLLLGNFFKFKDRLFAFLPVLIAQTSWFIYMYFRLENGSDILNPQKIKVIIFLLLIAIGVILLSKSSFLATKIFPLLNRYYLLPFFLVLVTLVLIRPAQMWGSLVSFFSNLLLSGNWGVTYWLFIIILILKVFENRVPIESFLMNILVSSTIIIIGLGVFREPYHLGWTDSANRLMTIGLPIGLMLLSVTLCKWFNYVVNPMDISEKSES